MQLVIAAEVLILVALTDSYRTSPPCVMCRDSTNCERFGADLCLNHTCYKSTDTSKCQYTPNVSESQCNDTSDCVEKSKCLHGYCTCDPGYRHESESKSCVKYTIGDACLYSYDCIVPLGEAAICSDGFCTCKDSGLTHFMGGCYKPARLNSPCLHDEECLLRDNNTMCRVWCMCETGYQAYNMRCQPYSTVNYSITPNKTRIETTENALFVVAIGSVLLVIIFTALKCLRKYRRSPMLMFEVDKREPAGHMLPHDTSTLIEPPPRDVDQPPSYEEVTSPNYKSTVPEHHLSHREYQLS